MTVMNVMNVMSRVTPNICFPCSPFHLRRPLISDLTFMIPSILKDGQIQRFSQVHAKPEAKTDRLYPWNNGKSGANLDLTRSTTPGLQIHTVDHTWTANPCDWLPCCRAALLLVGYPHSLVYLHLTVVEGLIFCISATPHLGTSFPLFHGASA